jgi:hypothetical protein
VTPKARGSPVRTRQPARPRRCSPAPAPNREPRPPSHRGRWPIQWPACARRC